MTRCLLIITILLSTLGCNSGDQLHGYLEDYQARMANVLAADTVKTPSVSLAKFPSLAEMNHQEAEQSIKLFEFYQLKHCALYTLVAERNTSLGRLQLPSTRYLYERKLLIALSDCIKQTSDPALKENLQQWYAIKKQNLGTSWASLMQFSSEIRRAFSSNFGSINGSKDDGLVQTKQALEYLVKISENEQPSGTELEKHLKVLNNNFLPAKLWFSQLLLTEHLNKTTLWLTENTADLTCSQGSSKEKAEYLRNVFQLFFIEKIQPLAGQINHYHYQLSPIFEKIAQHPDLSFAYKQYIQTQDQQGFAKYQKAMQQHITFWQDFFKRCNFSPKKT